MATKTKTETSPKKKPSAKAAASAPMQPGDLGSTVTVYTRNPINAALTNKGIVVKRNDATGTRTVRIELNEGGFRDVVCRTEPGPNLDPYWN